MIFVGISVSFGAVIRANYVCFMMIKAILGKKVKMTRIFDKDGKTIPVTLISAGPCFVTQIKSVEKDGYNAVQLGFESARKLTKPEEKHLAKAKIKDKLKNLREFRTDESQIKDLKLGDEINTSMFAEGDKVIITSISKGKGFAGVIKRHGFHRGPETHGSGHHRAPGSIGSMFPQHVIKGRKMPGHMGHERITGKAKIVKIIPETNIIMIKGAVSGPNRSLIEIRG